MTRLLVSVRDVAEAELAACAGAHLVDVKEPRRGSLGPADPATIQAVCSQIASRVPVSAALGELLGLSMPDTLARSRPVRYVKLGLAHCRDAPDWRERWTNVLQRLPATAVPIAVVYADWRQAGAPGPWRVLEAATRLGCGGVLVDTFNKSGGNLLDHVGCNELSALVTACRNRKMLAVLAGSLSRQTIRSVLPLGADYVAVRGAACDGDRRGRINATRVRQLVGQINGVAPGRMEI